MTASVTIDRSSLSLSDLVIGDFSTLATGTYVLTEKGLGAPAITARLTYYPDSPDIHGSHLRAAVKEQSSLPLEVLVQAPTAAALQTAIDDLDAALWQFTYTVAVAEDGVTKTWTGYPASWSLANGNRVPHVGGFFEVLTITIPVYPIPS